MKLYRLATYPVLFHVYRLKQNILSWIQTLEFESRIGYFVSTYSPHSWINFDHCREVLDKRIQAKIT